MASKFRSSYIFVAMPTVFCVRHTGSKVTGRKGLPKMSRKRFSFINNSVVS